MRCEKYFVSFVMFVHFHLSVVYFFLTILFLLDRAFAVTFFSLFFSHRIAFFHLTSLS